MEQKIFNKLVDKEFVTDYEQKYAQIINAEQKAVEDSAIAQDICEQEVQNDTNTMQTFKLIVEERLQAIDEKIKADLVVAEEKHLADIKQCENRKNVAQKHFAKATKENETKKTKQQNANAKVVAEIEKKHKSETTIAEKKQKR